jgi:hypothetical protein
MERIHTLRTIADELGRDKRTVQNWYTQAKDQHGELGEIIDGTRYFNAEERSILVSYAGADCTPTKTTAKVEIDSGNHQLVLKCVMVTSLDLTINSAVSSSWNI